MTIQRTRWSHSPSRRPMASTVVVVEWKTPNITDNSGDVVNMICNKMPGTDFGIGITRVVCVASDGSGNEAECSFFVHIRGAEHQEHYSV